MPQTLREYFDEGHTLLVVCSGEERSCRHQALVELPSIIQRLGWDFNFDRERWKLQAMLACSNCGRANPYLFMQRRTGEEDRGPGIGVAHGGETRVSYEEALRRSLELRAMARERDANDPVRPRAGRVRKFGPGR